MGTGSIITTNGKELILDRTFNAIPTRTAVSQFKVGIGTTTPLLADTDLETPVSIDGDNFKNFVNGFPSLDFVTLQSTIRCLLLSTEANGNTLTEFGIVNTDGIPVMFSRSVFTAISKTTSNEIAFIEKDKIL